MSEELEANGHFDFYRCARCGRVITRTQEVVAFGKFGNGMPCDCGGGQYSPTFPAGEPPDLEPGAGKDLDRDAARRLFDAAMESATDEWRSPNVSRYAWLRYRGEM